MCSAREPGSFAHRFDACFTPRLKLYDFYNGDSSILTTSLGG